MWRWGFVRVANHTGTANCRRARISSPLDRSPKTATIILDFTPSPFQTRSLPPSHPHSRCRSSTQLTSLSSTVSVSSVNQFIHLSDRHSLFCLRRSSRRSQSQQSLTHQARRKRASPQSSRAREGFTFNDEHVLSLQVLLCMFHKGVRPLLRDFALA